MRCSFLFIFLVFELFYNRHMHLFHGAFVFCSSTVVKGSHGRHWFPKKLIVDKNNVKTFGNCRRCVCFVCRMAAGGNWPIWVCLWFIGGVGVINSKRAPKERKPAPHTHTHAHACWDHTASINQQPSEKDKETREWQISAQRRFMLVFKLHAFSKCQNGIHHL